MDAFTAIRTFGGIVQFLTDRPYAIPECGDRDRLIDRQSPFQERSDDRLRQGRRPLDLEVFQFWTDAPRMCVCKRAE